MSKDSPKKPCCEFAEDVCPEKRVLNPPGYKKPKKYSKIMEKALEAVAQMGKKTSH